MIVELADFDNIYKEPYIRGESQFVLAIVVINWIFLGLVGLCCVCGCICMCVALCKAKKAGFDAKNMS